MSSSKKRKQKRLEERRYLQMTQANTVTEEEVKSELENFLTEPGQTESVPVNTAKEENKAPAAESKPEVPEKAPETSAKNPEEKKPEPAKPEPPKEEKKPEPAKEEAKTEEKKEEPAKAEEPSEEPVPAESDDEKKKSKESSPLYFFKIILVLTVICVGIALLLAVVNNMTKDIIAENAVREKQEAILAVFPSGDEVKPYEADGEEIFLVLKNGEIIGYCVNATGNGYGGEVDMMIGLDAGGAVSGLKVISMSETPGVGSKIQADSFLAHFIGFDHEIEIGTDVDGISGASFSSKAVAQAVNHAVSINVNLEEAAAAVSGQDKGGEQ